MVLLDGEEELTIATGLQQEPPPTGYGVQEMSEATKKLDNDIKKIYDANFVRIVNKNNKYLQKGTMSAYVRPYPPAFDHLFSGSDLRKIQGEYVWIKVIFPNERYLAAADAMRCFPNVIPVVARSFETKYERLVNSDKAILPLYTNDPLLYISSIKSSDGSEFAASNKTIKGERTTNYLNNNANIAAFTDRAYTIRSLGTKRFDDRDADLFLRYLLELTKDEATAFSTLDNVNEDLKQLENTMSGLKEKLDKSTAAQQHKVFLFMRGAQPLETLTLEYCTHNDANSKKVSVGTPLSTRDAMGYKRDSARLLTNIIGANTPSQQQKLTTLRAGLLSRGRIVTPEDLKAFCLSELGDAVRSVEIKQGVTREKDGIVRCVWAEITPSGELQLDDLRARCERLQKEINLRSSRILPTLVRIV